MWAAILAGLWYAVKAIGMAVVRGLAYVVERKVVNHWMWTDEAPAA